MNIQDKQLSWLSNFLFVFLSRYNLRLEAMLQKEEFQITVETIEPSLESLKGAIQGVHSFYELLKSGTNMKRISLLFSNICY